MKSDPNSSTTMVLWINEFSSEMFQEYYSKFTEMENDDSILVIPIIIASYGGEAIVELGLRDLIKSSAKPVATIALGSAMSAGACLLAAGSPGFRFAAPSAQIMIHEAASGVSGKCTDMKNEATFVDKLNRLMIDNFAEDSGLDVDFIEFEFFVKRKNADFNLSAQEAKELNLIDHIGIPRFYPEPAYYNMVIPGNPDQVVEMLTPDPEQKKPSKSSKKGSARKPATRTRSRKKT